MPEERQPNSLEPALTPNSHRGPPNRWLDVKAIFELALTLDSAEWSSYLCLKCGDDQELRRERPGHTLQGTGLVHEAYLKLIGQRQVEWRNRNQFFAVAAEMIRRILVDHARGRVAAKRGGAIAKVSLDEALVPAADERDLNLVALDDALVALAAADPQQSRIVELRYFAGLTIEDTAMALQISPATVKRDWTMAKAFLKRAMLREKR